MRETSISYSKTEGQTFDFSLTFFLLNSMINIGKAEEESKPKHMIVSRVL